MLNTIVITEQNKMLSGIYIIKSKVDSRIYIGSTKCFNVRIKCHLSELKGNRHGNIYLQNFHNKHIIKKENFYIVEICSMGDLLVREQYYLDNVDMKFNIAKIAGAPDPNRSFNKKQVEDIAILYNSGSSACKISELLYNSRNYRSQINLMIKGETYPEYSYMFNVRKYNQIGRVVESFKTFSDEDKKFIEDNIDLISCREMAKILNNPRYWGIMAYKKQYRELTKDILKRSYSGVGGKCLKQTCLNTGKITLFTPMKKAYEEGYSVKLIKKCCKGEIDKYLNFKWEYNNEL